LQQIYSYVMRNKKPLTSHIPNLITSLNLLTGCISISLSFQDGNKILLASVLIFVAGIFDFLDGVAARVLHAYSDIGKMLDSLADVVSFGVAPSAILYKLLIISISPDNSMATPETLGFLEQIIPFTAFLIAIFSAFRLAKFNLDERQINSFIGIPTPANAFLIASLPFILHDNVVLQGFILRIYVLVPLIVLLSILLISDIPMISLKFKDLSYKNNKSRYMLLITSLLLLIILRFSAVPFVFLIYIIISLIDKPQNQVAA
jgi:CDP-diacylglycerol---serine O-phosphatidyltransferase